MDTTFISFIGGGSLVAVLLVNVLKTSLEGISERWGALATQCVVLGVSLVIALILGASTLLPQGALETMGQIFVGAIAIYEVLYKAIWQKAIKNNV